MNYTSIEQSKKLLELGLNPESADMCYQMVVCEDASNGIYDPTIKGSALDLNYDTDIPCWSVGALLDIIPMGNLKIVRNELSLWKIVFDNCCSNISYSNKMDAVFAFICYLLENNHIKKG